MAWLEEHLELVKLTAGSAYCAFLMTLAFGWMTATWILLAVAIAVSALAVRLDEF